MRSAGAPVGGTGADIAEGRAVFAFTSVDRAFADARALTLVALFVPAAMDRAVIGRTADEALVALRETARVTLPRRALPARPRLGLVDAGEGPIADAYYAAAAPFALTPFALEDPLGPLDAALLPNAAPWTNWALASGLDALAVPAERACGVILCGRSAGLLAAIGDAIHRASGLAGPLGRPLTAPLAQEDGSLEHAAEHGVDRTGMNGRA